MYFISNTSKQPTHQSNQHIKATKAIMNTKFESSIEKMKASFKVIDDSKTRAIVLDAPPPRKTIAATKKIVKIPAPSNEKSDATKITTTAKTTSIRPEIIASSKKTLSKKSKLHKLVNGKKTFDFST